MKGALQANNSLTRVDDFSQRWKEKEEKEKREADEGSPQRNISKDNLYILERKNVCLFAFLMNLPVSFTVLSQLPSRVRVVCVLRSSALLQRFTQLLTSGLRGHQRPNPP